MLAGRLEEGQSGLLLSFATSKLPVGLLVDLVCCCLAVNSWKLLGRCGAWFHQQCTATTFLGACVAREDN